MPVFKEERWQKIRDIMANDGKVTVNELAAMFGVSAMTVRRDLETIADKGLIERTHGGAVLSRDHNLLQEPIEMRLAENAEEKKAIGRAAAQLIKPGDKVYITGGTTTYWVAKALVNRAGLTIITNSLPIANVLCGCKELDVIIVGGVLRHTDYAIVGRFAESMVMDMRMDKVIVGTGGVHPQYGVTNEYSLERMIGGTNLSLSENIIVLADHTKIGRVATSRTADVSQIRTLVTSRLAPPDVIEGIRKCGVEVILV